MILDYGRKEENMRTWEGGSGDEGGLDWAQMSTLHAGPRMEKSKAGFRLVSGFQACHVFPRGHFLPSGSREVRMGKVQMGVWEGGSGAKQWQACNRQAGTRGNA